MELIEANWAVFAVALLAVLLVGWLLLRRGRSAPKREYKPDVLDQGASSVHRNQALIDAAPAAQIVPPALGATMAGVAEAVAVGAQDVVEEAEAAAAPPPTEGPEPTLEPEQVREPEPDPEPQPEPAPQAEPEPKLEPAAVDDLSRIKGLGPKLQALLPTLGLSTYAQIAALTEADLAELDGKLGAFAGRPAKDNWVEQARFLAEGDVEGFEGKFGKV
ncbi:MAG: hypothetical protein ACKOPM_01045 [Novosphingobium sp.]